MEDLDDFGELYADLEDRLIVCISTAEAEAEEDDKNKMEERGTWYENVAMESESSSDSEDDLQIVLNEGDNSNKFPAQLLAEGRDCEEDGMVFVSGLDCSGKEPNWTERVHSADGLLQGNGDRRNAKGSHRNWSSPCLAGSAARAWNSLPRRSHCDHFTVPCSSGNTSYTSGFPMEFSNGYAFYLPRNRSIFNIDVESFERKPWRTNGADITDYFNFGFDEEGWKTYCSQLPTGIMSGEVNQHGRDSGLEVPDYVENGSKGIRVPKGRAIHVESGNGHRIPSVDVRRPRNRDSDVVIQITTRIIVEDAVDPMIKRITYLDDNKSKSELLLSSKDELCKSSSSVSTRAYMKKPLDKKPDNMNCGGACPSGVMTFSIPDAVIAGHYSSSPKSSDHNGFFETSRDEVSLDKVPSPECIHLNSDSLLQESVLSHCYLSSETGFDSKTDSACSGGHSPESLLDVNYCQQTTIYQMVDMNCSSDDEVASPLVHRQKIDGDQQTKESGTIFRLRDDESDERDHSSQGSKISLKNSIKYNNDKEVNGAVVLACSKDHDEDPSPVRNKEKIITAREVKTSKNSCCNNQRAQHNSRAWNIVNRDYLQSDSGSMSLYDKRSCLTNRRVDRHDMILRTDYDSMEAKHRHREGSLDDYRVRSLDKYFGRCVPYLVEEDERFIDKYDRDPHSAGPLRRLQEFDRDDKTLLVNLEISNRHVYNHQDSRISEDVSHPRIYGEAYDEDKRVWPEDGSYRYQVPSLFKPDRRYMCHSGHSHTGETFSQLRSKHGKVSSKICFPLSRTGFNLDDDLFPSEVRKSCPDDSAYNESRKSSLDLHGLVAKEEIRHQGSKSSSPTRYTLSGIAQLQNGLVDKRSFSKRKIYDNHHQNRSGRKLTVRSGMDSDSVGRVGCLSDSFVKDRHEFEDRGCRQAVNEHLNGWKVKTKERCPSGGGSIHTGADISNDNEESSYYPTCSKDGYSNYSNCMTKSSNKLPINEEEIEELEEGQLVEETDNHETAEIKCKSDGRTPALTAEVKMDLTNPVNKNKLVGRYDRNHLLETLAKMEKRLERFKDPIPPKKEPENCGNMQRVTAIEDEVKQHRPARKRRWGNS